MSANLRQDGLLLKQALPYINKYRGQCFIFITPADLIKQQMESGVSGFGEDWAICRSLGIHCIICVDMGVARGQPIDEAALKKFLARHVQLYNECSSLINRGAYKLEERPHFMQGNWILARPLGIIEGTDMLYHGRVRKIDSHSMFELMMANHTLLVSPLAPDKQGISYVLNERNLVAELITLLKADKVIIYTGQLPSSFRMNAIPRTQASAYMKNIRQPLQEKIADMIYYCDKGVSRSHLIPANEENALVNELLTAPGYGLMINTDSYEELIAPEPNEMEAIKALIEPLETEGSLRPRSLKQLRAKAGNFRVIKQDNNIIGCAALSPIAGKKGFVELECVVVKESYNGQGYGTRILNSIESLAASQGYTSLVVLTTQAMEWFQEKGFKPTAEPLPLAEYCTTRNAQVLIKDIRGLKSQSEIKA